MVNRLFVAKLALLVMCLMLGMVTRAQNVPQFSSEAAKSAWVQSHPNEYMAAGGKVGAAPTTIQAGQATVPTLLSAGPNKVGTDAVVNPAPVETRQAQVGEVPAVKIAEAIVPLTGPMEDLDEETLKTYSPEKRQYILDHPEKFRVVKYGETSK